MLRLLTQDAAKRLDDKLMGELGFSVDQLMELAGLAVAQAIFKEYPPCKVLVVCGPGNNGGDGLVAARHLHHFGYCPTVLYPKATASPLYQRLVQQCTGLGIEVLPSVADYTSNHLIVDAIFGFSFRGAMRPPFDQIVQDIKRAGVAVASVDIPSGWDVETGNTSGAGVEPAMLISLSAPKLCVQHFTGTHYVGGRFVPAGLQEEFGFDLPQYEGAEQVVKLT